MSHFKRQLLPGQKRNTGYSWHFFYVSRSWVYGLILTLVVIGASGSFFLWYSHYGDDLTASGIVGLSYALAGITFLLLAAAAYSRRRRSETGTLGQLNAALTWHIFFAIMGLALLLMHSFGNFNARSGTYALYSLIALVSSGFLGRLLDRLLPRLIAGEVHKALTAQGEDRIEAISQKLQAIVTSNMQEVRNCYSSSFSPSPVLTPGASMTSKDLPSQHSLNTSWDLAYTSLENTVQKLSREEDHLPFIADKHNTLAQAGTEIPNAQEQLSVLRTVHRAMQRERIYRYIIRYWRTLHILLAVLTIGLTIWHLIYAMQFLLVLLVGQSG